jgi:DNA-binding NarL/FixJ family response regulator
MPATVNRDLAALRLILNLAIRKEYIAKNPVQEVQFLDEGPGQMRIVSHEEQKNYMAAASPLLRDVAALIVETGMRPEEVFTIRKENVHLERLYPFIPSGKTRFARRNIQLTDAEGLTNCQVGQQLGVAEQTDANNLFRIYEKLGISSRVELVLYARSPRQG